MNKIKCLVCNTILVSESRHDFQACKCDNHSYCDGGDDYQRIGGRELEKIHRWNGKKFVPLKTK